MKKEEAMDERDRETGGTSLADDEEVVRRLLETAGPQPEVPQEDLDAIAAAARTAWQEQVRRRAGAPARRRSVRMLTAALAAALALALGLAWWLARQSDDGSPTPAAPAEIVARVEALAGPVQLEAAGQGPRPLTAGEPIPLGAALRSGGEEGDEGSARTPGRAALRLSGGAAVRLDAGTRLRLLSPTVLELTRGALYVDTGLEPRMIAGPAPQAAIEIRTPAGTARDVGTRFAVRVVGRGREALLVRVRDGAVQAEHRGRSYLTLAGQELVLRRDGTAQRRAAAAYGPEWDWTLEASPEFAIEGRTLREFLDWVSRDTGWQIRFTDPGLKEEADQIVLHGSIGRLRADQAPLAVLPGAGLAGEVQDGTLVIRRRP
jgi:FecR-like protein